MFLFSYKLSNTYNISHVNNFDFTGRMESHMFENNIHTCLYLQYMWVSFFYLKHDINNNNAKIVTGLAQWMRSMLHLHTVW